MPGAQRGCGTCERCSDRPSGLEPTGQWETRVFNFGRHRDPLYQSFQIEIEPPLPAGAEQRLNLVADVMTRTDEGTADTVVFPEPKFSRFRVSGNRKRLSFEVCLTPPKDLPAGTYTSVVYLEGPPGVEGTAVAMTANAKDGGLFVLGLIGTLLAAAAVLLFKAAADVRAAAIEGAKSKSKPQQDAAAKWRPAFGEAFGFGWLATTSALLIATGGSLILLYTKDPAWGAGGVASLIALVSAGLAAIGVKTVFTSSGSK